MEREIIGFAGLGNMGGEMAKHLAGAGYPLVVFDIDAERRNAFAAQWGAKAVETPGDLAEATVVLTMVPTGAVVRATLHEGGERSLLSRLAPGSLVIDTTSSPPQSTRELGAVLAPRGIHLIDAPVSGGRKGAQEADLVFMMGGDDQAALDRAAAVLSHLGRRIFRLGSLGAGHTMKSLNNYVSAAAYIGACEALTIGAAHGLEPAVMNDVFNVSTARSFATETSIRRIIAKDESRNFALDLFTKDIKIAADLGDERGIHAPLTHLAHDRMAEARDAIGGHDDHTHAFAFWAKQRREGSAEG